MCTTNDANRYLELAKIHKGNNKPKLARECYLEAAAIFTLQAQIQKKPSLIKHANIAYNNACIAIDKQPPNIPLTLKQLAKKTLDELNKIPHNHPSDVNFLETIQGIMN